MFENTLLLTCSYIQSDIKRVLKFWKYYSKIFPNIRIYNDGPLEKEILDKLPRKLRESLYCFETHLGRSSIVKFEGWWRSFRTGVLENTNWNKIVWIETDCYVLSKNLFNYLDESNNGYISLYSKNYIFPDSSIQVINKDKYYLIEHTNSQPPNDIIEKILPFTHIEKQFIGDRHEDYIWEEHIKIEEQDYFCQCATDLDIVKLYKESKLHE